MKFRSLLLLLPVCLMVSCANKAKSDYDMTDPYGTGALDEFAGASPAPSTTPTPSTSSAADTTYNSKPAYSDANSSSSYTPEPSHISKPAVKKTVTKTVAKKIPAPKLPAPKKTIVSKKVVTKPPVVAKKAPLSKKVVTKKVVEKKVVKPTTHTVVGGDSLSRIASRNGVSVSTLKRLNGLKSDVIRPGQKLRVK